MPLAGLGVVGGAREIAHGNYWTGAFDIVSAVAPFGSKNVRAATFGRGTYYGQWAGAGPAAPWSVRSGRFAAIEANLRPTLEPSPFGRDVGIGYARRPGDTAGHSGVVIDEGQGLTLFHKNAQRSTVPGWKLEASWSIDQPLPSEYLNNTGLVPFEYETVRVPKSVAELMSGYARSRMSTPEQFAFGSKSCGNFTADVLQAGGLKNMAGDMSAGVRANFLTFLDARTAASLAYAAGFWTGAQQGVTNRKSSPGG